MIGELTEYKTLVTQELIDRTQARVDELKSKERKWYGIGRRLPQEN